MGSNRCVTCGQPTSGSTGGNSPEWLDLGSEDDPWGAASDSSDVASSRRPRLIAAAAVTILALFVAGRIASALVFGEDAAEDQATPVDEVIEEVVVPEPEAALSVAEFFRTNVDQGSTRYAVAFSRGGEVEVLSAEGQSSPEPRTATTFAEVARFPLFSDGEQTWGINPEDPNEVLVASANYRIVKTNVSGGVAYMKLTAEDQTRVGVLMFGVWNSPELRLSPADRLIPVDTFGVIVVPETGGSFLMANTELEELTSANILDATSSSAVLRQCTDTLDCVTIVASNINPQTDFTALESTEGVSLVEVDLDPAASIAVSPDGRWIATWSQNGLRIVDTTDGSTGERLTVAPPERVAWAPDSSFITWTSTGRLQFTRPGETVQDGPVLTLAIPDATFAQSLVVTARQ